MGLDVVFLGPSLSREQAQRIYPDAIYLPPARMGDLVSAVRRYRPHAIALIDGSFFQSMATYHKEIIEALHEGIWVIGASSMGALRAAECSAFGMIGVGQVHQAYATGIYEDDDEVALSHVDGNFDFRPVTDALVDIRASLQAAAEAGVIDEPEHRELVAMQKARWFMERHLLESVSDARTLSTMDAGRVAQLDVFLRSNRVSVKEADAREALRVLRDLPPGPLPEARRPARPLSSTYSGTIARDVVVHSEEDDPISLDKIRRFFCLIDSRSAEVWRSVRDRTAIHRLMESTGVQLTERDLQEAKQALANDLQVSIAQFEDECAALDMTAVQIAAWIEEEAYVRRARAWIGGRAMYTLFTTEFLNQLRRSGDYRTVRRGAAFQEKVMSGSPHRHTEIGLNAAMAVFSDLSSWEVPEDLDDYLLEHNLGSRAEFYERLMAGVAAGMEIFGLPAIEFSDDVGMDHRIAPKTSRGG